MGLGRSVPIPYTRAVSTPAPQSERAELRRRAARSVVAQRLLNQPLRNLGVGVTAIVLGATAAFGGLEPAEERSSIDVIEIGTKASVPPYDITIRKVVWVDELPGIYKAADENRWLAITATVRNTHNTSLYGANELAQAVTLAGVEGMVSEPVRGTDRVKSTQRPLLLDSSELQPVQPGLDYDIAFLFEQKGSVPPPEEVTVQLVRHTWREDSINKTSAWLDPEVIAEGRLPMRKSDGGGEEGSR
jgi:hypothetical protein